MKKEIFAREASYQGMPCVELSAGGYYALLAPEIGSSMLRLSDTINNIEVFRFNENVSIETIKSSPEVYGFPTLFLPNRLDRGELKTSDDVYYFPINEGKPLYNYLHGFLHKRKHTVKKIQVENDSAIVKTEYIYDKNDECYKFFPVEFKAEFTYILSESGLEQFVTMTNLSEKMLPLGLCSHTTINAPFVDGGDVSNIRLRIPVGEKCELNERCLPTERLLALTDYDNQYKEGTINSATTSIDNDMYFAETFKLDDEDFHGAVAEDISNGKKIFYETGDEYKFWIIWNEWGNKGYFCPEPITWMINAPNLLLPDNATGYEELSPKESFTAYQHFYTKA